MKKGQTLIEYVLIVLLISVIAVALVSYFGGYLRDAITRTACNLADEVYEKGRRPGEGKCVVPDEDEEDEGDEDEDEGDEN